MVVRRGLKLQPAENGFSLVKFNCGLAQKSYVFENWLLGVVQLVPVLISILLAVVGVISLISMKLLEDHGVDNG